MTHYNASWINNIADEGTKAEAVHWLAKTWDELETLRIAVRALIADVKGRHPGEELFCPYMRELDRLTRVIALDK